MRPREIVFSIDPVVRAEFERLPPREPDRILAGPGTGETCQLCGGRTLPQEIEYELEYTIAGLRRSYTVHLRCSRAWDAERRRRRVAEAQHS